MRKTEVTIKGIDNGWLLTIEGDDLTIAVTEKYFATFPEVLAHLHKLNIK